MINYDNKSWLKLIFSWRGTVLPKLMIRSLIVMIWATIVVYLYHFEFLAKDFKVDMVVFSVVGLALGLLLVFRTNTSYDRYWEGRKLIGANVNSWRNFSLLLNNIIPKEEKILRNEIAELATSINHAIKERLRDGVKDEHIKMLRQEYRELVLKSNHVPLAIIKILSERVEFIKLTFHGREMIVQSAVNEISNIVSNMGGLERIRFTPLPFAYASHLRTFITLYFLSIPFGLYQQLHWAMIPILGIIVVVLEGINEIGIEIEDPFGDDPNDLPMDTICENTDKNIKEILVS